MYRVVTDDQVQHQLDALLGPRIDAHVVSRLRRLACPTSAAALLLALAADCRVGRLTHCVPRRIAPDFGQVGMLTGIYRIPTIAGPLLRASLLDHQARGLPYYALFVHPAGGLLLTQRMANLIARAAALAGVPRPLAATRAGRSDSGPEPPFAAELVDSGGVRIDGAGPPPRLRPHLRPRTLPYVGRRTRTH